MTMQKSPLQIARQSYQPKMPVALRGAVRLVEGEKTQTRSYRLTVHGCHRTW